MSGTTEEQKIYIVASYCGTLPGRLIYHRARLKFWNRYPGDNYSHISLSTSENLDDMLSFARLRLHNFLVAGLARENIHTGVFALHPKHTRIAVFEIPVSIEQYNGIKESMELAWENKKNLRYNYLGLFFMLITGRGVARKNHYFCSQWVTEILNYNSICLFGNKKPYHVRPFDMYIALKNHIIFEGYLTSYPLYHNNMEMGSVCAGVDYTYSGQ